MDRREASEQTGDRMRTLERELKDTREREAAYRDRLFAAAERTQHLRQHATALVDMLGKRPPQRRDLVRALTDTARISSRALGVTRTSLWLFDAAGEMFECKLLLSGDNADTCLQTMPTSDSPAYFSAIRSSSGVVAVEDALHDPRTVELETYLRQHGVTALLDILIAIPGRLMGVVCHEHTAGPRVWYPEEIDFATQVSNLIALALEVDLRQVAEAKAQSAEARYRYLVESLPVTVYSLDPFSGAIEYLSPQIRELGSFDAEEWLAHGVKAWLAAVHEDDRAQVEARFTPHGVEAMPAEIYYRLRVPNGGVRFIRDHCRVVRNHIGVPVAIQGILADVTEQRRSEERAREFERRLRMLLEHVDLLAMILDVDGKIEFVNACFEQVTGRPAASLLGEDYFALLMPPGEAQATRARYQREVRIGKVVQRVDNEIVTRAGERRRVLWTVVLLRAADDTPAGICSLGLDITDRVQGEAALLQQTKLESLGQLSAGVAHDFNNLLTVMATQASRLSQTLPDAERQAAVLLLEQSLRQAGELTRSLLVYARREPVRPTSLVVDGVIEETIPLLSALSGDGIAIVSSLRAPKVQVEIDAAQLRQLLMNLTSNAVDATRQHGRQVLISTNLEFVEPSVEARGSARERGAELQTRGGGTGRFLALSVVDDGCGMDARTLARVFEPFFTTKRQAGGTGLGLAMCQAIVTRAGGFIRVQSSPGEGTSCRAYLPVAAERVGPLDEPAARTARALSPAYALVVEDEPAIRSLLVASLEQLGLHVLSAGTVAEAVRVAASESIDLLVTDGNLPDGSGRVLARSARAARPHLLVLLVSGAPEDAQEFDATLHKPFAQKELIATVGRLLNERRAEGQSC